MRLSIANSPGRAKQFKRCLIPSLLPRNSNLLLSFGKLAATHKSRPVRLETTDHTLRGVCAAALTKADGTLVSDTDSPSRASEAPVSASAAAELFPTSHIAQTGPAFFLYFPVGVGVACIRILLWVVLLLIDQPWLTDNGRSIAVLQAILGVRVVWENAEAIPDERHVLVSNHITTGDLMALYRRPERVVHLISTALPKRVAQAKHHRVDLRHACLETYDALANGQARDSIHLFPEGGMTNGKGMMKFSRGFLRFADGLSVVPVALRASLPWRLSTHTLTSSFLSNLFWQAARAEPIF